MCSKQCRPWSDVSFCGIWSGSTLFAQACLSRYLGLLGYYYTLRNFHVHPVPVITYHYKGSNMVFHALTFARSRGRCWKLRPKAVVFNTSQGTWRMLMHWKTLFNHYYCIKTENICYISRYFLHYFVLPFHRCRTNAISTYYAYSRAGQYTSRDGSKSVALVRSYWKLHNRALTARELPC